MKTCIINFMTCEVELNNTTIPFENVSVSILAKKWQIVIDNYINVYVDDIEIINK